MSLPDEFTMLKEQVESADRSIRAAVAQDDAELKAMVDDARKRADDREAELRAKSTEVADEAERDWNEVQSEWSKHIQRIREHLEAKKAAGDGTDAERVAAWATADGAEGIHLAAAANEEAQYAVLDAVMARRKADVLAAAK